MIPIGQWLRLPEAPQALDTGRPAAARSEQETGDASPQEALLARYQEGFRDGSTAAAGRHSEVLREQQERHGSELAAQAALLRREAGQELTETIGREIDALRQAIEAEVSRIIGQTVLERFRQDALSAFSGVLIRHLRNEEDRLLTVLVPPSLQAAIQSDVSREGLSVHFEDAAEDECSARLNAGGFATCIADWAAELAGRLHGG